MDSKISEEYRWRYFFHMTDVRNLDSIIKNGLLCTNLKNEKRINHVNIANEDIQDRRAEMDVPCRCFGKVHDYVPFYFSSLNPMLLGVLNKKIIDQPLIVFLCLRIQKIKELNAIFTDASANTVIPPKFFDDVCNLPSLDWQLIDSKKWSFKDDVDRHKKMAEVLIYNKVNFSDIDNIVVYNDSIRKEVYKILESNQISDKIVLLEHDLAGHKYNFYYTKWFIPGQEHITLINGPLLLKRNFDQCVSDIIQSRESPLNRYTFQNIESMVSAIDNKFDSIIELAGIYDLETDNIVHPETVSFHTISVVHNIQQTEYYKNSDAHLQCLLKLAAYLHDIGKGPKSKWKEGKQKAYPDHPSDALPMLRRILIEDIHDLNETDIRWICLLVAYHDIIGDCKFKGRNCQEIVNIIHSETELDMLFAIAESDIQSISPIWYSNLISCKAEYKKQILDLMKK